MALFKRFFSRAKPANGRPAKTTDANSQPSDGGTFSQLPLLDDQNEQLALNRMILDVQTQAQDERLHREVDKEVRSAAEVSLKRLHVIQRGRCPKCGDALRQHLFAAVCDACGWHHFDAPRQGPVRVHLTSGDAPVEGERAYVVKTGTVLLLRNDVVIARIPASAVAWVEYVWGETELAQRQRAALERLKLACGWCSGAAIPENNGFHLVQTAFGSSQERYCFCSDDCYEAFRKMYPSRVHRNCYERPCASCDLCIKRYEDETEGLRTLAKDLLKAPRSG